MRLERQAIHLGSYGSITELNAKIRTRVCSRNGVSGVSSPQEFAEGGGAVLVDEEVVAVG